MQQSYKQIYYDKPKHSILAGTMPAKNSKNWFLVIHLANSYKIARSIKVHKA
jgi:hypothetical protein